MFNGYNEIPLISYEFDDDKDKKQENVGKWTYKPNGEVQPPQPNPHNRQSECWSGKPNFSGLPNALNISSKCNCSGCYSSAENHSYQGDSTRHRPWLPRSFPVPLNGSGDACKLPGYQWDEFIAPNQNLCFSENVISTSQYSQGSGGKPFYYRHYESLRLAESNQLGVITSVKNLDAKNLFSTQHKVENSARENMISYDQNGTRQSMFGNSPYNSNRQLGRKIDSRNCTSNFGGPNEKYSNADSFRHASSYSADQQTAKIPVVEPYMKAVPSLINPNRVPSTGHRNAKECMFQSYVDQGFNDSRINFSDLNSVNAKMICQTSLRKDGTVPENFLGEQSHNPNDSSSFMFDYTKNKVLHIDQRSLNMPQTCENMTVIEGPKYRCENTRQTDYYTRSNVLDTSKRNNQNSVLENRKDCAIGQMSLADQYHCNMSRYNQASNVTKCLGLPNSKNLYNLKEYDDEKTGKMEKFEQFSENVTLFQRSTDSANNQSVYSRLPDSTLFYNGPRDLRFPNKTQNSLSHQNSSPGCRNYISSEYSYQDHSQNLREYSLGVSGLQRFELNQYQQQKLSQQTSNCSSEQYTSPTTNSNISNSHFQQFENFHKILPQHIYLNKSQPPNLVKMGLITQNHSENASRIFETKKINNLESVRSEEMTKNGSNKMSPLRLLRKKKILNQRKENFSETNFSEPETLTTVNNLDATPALDVRKFWSTWAEEEEENVSGTQMVVLDCQNIDADQAKLLQLYETEAVRTVHFESNSVVTLKPSEADKKTEKLVRPVSTQQEVRTEFEHNCMLNDSVSVQTISKQICENELETIQPKETPDIKKVTESVLPVTPPNVFANSDSAFETDCRLLACLPTSPKAAGEESFTKTEPKTHKREKNTTFQVHKGINRNRKICADEKTDESNHLDKWTEKKFDFLKRAEESKAAKVLRHEEEKKKIFEKRLAFQQSNTLTSEKKKEKVELETCSLDREKIVLPKQDLDDEDSTKTKDIKSDRLLSIDENSQSNSPDAAYMEAPKLPTSEFRRNKFLDYAEPKIVGNDIFGIENDLPVSNTEDFEKEKIVKQEFPANKFWSNSESCFGGKLNKNEVNFSLKMQNEMNFPNSKMEDIFKKMSDMNFQNSQLKFETEKLNERFTDKNENKNLKSFKKIKTFRNKQNKKKKKLNQEEEKEEKMDQVKMKNISVPKPTIKFSIQKSHDLKISFKVLNNKNKTFEHSGVFGKKEEENIENLENSVEIPQNCTKLLTLKLKSFQEEISQSDKAHKSNKKKLKQDLAFKKNKRKFRPKKNGTSKLEMKTPVLKIKKSRYMSVEREKDHSSENPLFSNDFPANEMDDSTKMKLTFKNCQSDEKTECKIYKDSEESSKAYEITNVADFPATQVNFDAENYEDMFLQSGANCILDKLTDKLETNICGSQLPSLNIELSKDDDVKIERSIKIFKEPIPSISAYSVFLMQEKREAVIELNDEYLNENKKKELEMEQICIPQRTDVNKKGEKEISFEIGAEGNESEYLYSTFISNESESTKVRHKANALDSNEKIKLEQGKNHNIMIFEDNGSYSEWSNEIENEFTVNNAESIKELDLKTSDKFRVSDSISCFENMGFKQASEKESKNVEKFCDKPISEPPQSKDDSNFDTQSSDDLIVKPNNENILEEKSICDFSKKSISSQIQNLVLFNINETHNNKDVKPDYDETSIFEGKEENILELSKVRNEENNKNNFQSVERTLPINESVILSLQEAPLPATEKKIFCGLTEKNLEKTKKCASFNDYSSLANTSLSRKNLEELNIDEMNGLKTQAGAFNKDIKFCPQLLEKAICNSKLESDLEDGEIIDDSSDEKESLKLLNSVCEEISQNDLNSESETNEIPTILPKEKNNFQEIGEKLSEVTENSFSKSNLNGTKFSKCSSLQFNKNKIERRHSAEENIFLKKRFQRTPKNMSLLNLKKRAISCPPSVKFFKKMKNFIPEIPVEEIPLPPGNPLPENCFDFITYFKLKKSQNKNNSAESKTKLSDKKIERNLKALATSNTATKENNSCHSHNGEKNLLSGTLKDTPPKCADNRISRNFLLSVNDEKVENKSKKEDLKKLGFQGNFKVKFSIAKRQNLKSFFSKIDDDESQVFQKKKKFPETKCEMLYKSEKYKCRILSEETTNKTVKDAEFDLRNSFQKKSEIPDKKNIRINFNDEFETDDNYCPFKNKVKSKKDVWENQKNLPVAKKLSEGQSERKYVKENSIESWDLPSGDEREKQCETEKRIEINIEEPKSNFDDKSLEISLIEGLELSDIETFEISNSKPTTDMEFDSIDSVREEFYEFEDIPTSEDLPSEGENAETEKVADEDKFRNIMQNCLDNAKKFLNVGNLKLFSCSVEDLLEEDSQTSETPAEETEFNRSSKDSINHFSRDVLLTSCEDTITDDLGLSEKFQPTDITMDFVPSFSEGPHTLCSEILPVDNWPYLEEEVPSSPSKSKNEENDLIPFLENVVKESNYSPECSIPVDSVMKEDYQILSQKVNHEKGMKQLLPRASCSNFKRVHRKSFTNKEKVFRKRSPLGLQRRKTVGELYENFSPVEKRTGKLQDFRNEFGILGNEQRKTESLWSSSKSLKCRLSLKKLSNKYCLEDKNGIIDFVRKDKKRPESETSKSGLDHFSNNSKTQIQSLIPKQYGPASKRKMSVDYKSSFWQPKVVLFRISKKELFKMCKKSFPVNHKPENNSEKTVREAGEKREMVPEDSSRNFKTFNSNSSFKVCWDSSLTASKKFKLLGQDERKISVSDNDFGNEKPKVLHEILKDNNGNFVNVFESTTNFKGKNGFTEINSSEKKKKIDEVKKSFSSVLPKDNSNLPRKRKKLRFRNLHTKKKNEPDATNIAKDASTAQDIVPKVCKLVSSESFLNEIIKGCGSSKEFLSHSIVKSTKSSGIEKIKNTIEKKKKISKDGNYKRCSISLDSFCKKVQSSSSIGTESENIENYKKESVKREKKESSCVVGNNSNTPKSKNEHRREKNESKSCCKHKEKTESDDKKKIKLESGNKRLISKSKKRSPERKINVKVKESFSVKNPEKIKPLPRKSEDKENDKVAEDESKSLWVCEVCGFNNDSERIAHIKSHPFHCQSCHLAFKTEAHFVNHLTKKHKDIRNQHHCLLCELSFDTEDQYQEHVETREHRHLESVEKNTINTLFTLLTGQPCPVLGLVEMKPEWLPSQAGTVHFYHQATPLSLALQYLKMHHDHTSYSAVSSAHPN